MTSDTVNIVISVNRYDSEPSNITLENIPLTANIGQIKSSHFADDISSSNNIRFIYRGKNLGDSTKVSTLESFDGVIKIIVFITKPPFDSVETPKNEATIWSTLGCLTFVIILAIYKLNYPNSFNWTSTTIFYIATTFTLHSLITSAVRRTAPGD